MSSTKNNVALVLLYLLVCGTAFMVVKTGDGAFVPPIFVVLAQLVFMSVMFRGWRALERTGRGLSLILLFVFPLSIIVVFSAVGAFPKLARESGHEVSSGAFTMYPLSFVFLCVSALAAVAVERIAAVAALVAGVCLIVFFVTQLIMVGQVARVYTAAWAKRSASPG